MARYAIGRINRRLEAPVPKFLDAFEVIHPAFEASDLRHLAAVCKLPISPRGEELEAIAERLNQAWTVFSLATIAAAHTTPWAVTINWAATVSERLRDTLSSLVGSAQLHSLDRQTLIALRELCNRGLSNLKSTDDRKRFDSLLRAADVLQEGEYVTEKTLANAMFKGLALLSALTMLSEALTREPQYRQGKRTPSRATWNGESLKWTGSFLAGHPTSTRRNLVELLPPIFEALHHGRKYSVSKYSTGGDGMRATRSAGPAVTWTRELLRMAAERQSEPPALSRAISEFLAWSIAKPEGFAKCVEIAGRTHRDLQRQQT